MLTKRAEERCNRLKSIAISKQWARETLKFTVGESAIIALDSDSDDDTLRPQLDHEPGSLSDDSDCI